MREEKSPESNSRRKFLARGAAVAAATATAGLTLAKPAAAANGDTMILGAVNSATNDTTIQGSRLLVNRDNDFSIRGFNGSGTGVVGIAGNSLDDGVGVRGSAGVGVWGEGGSSSLKGTGLRGTSVLGPSLLLDTTSITMPPSSGTWTAGSFVNREGALWFCYIGGAGAASKWVKLSGAPIILNQSYRAFDSRSGSKLINTTRTAIDMQTNGGGQMPNGTSAAIVTVTATQTNSSGYVSLFKDGTPAPNTSTLNWSASGSNIANTTIVALDLSAQLSARVVGSTHLLIDVIGYLP